MDGHGASHQLAASNAFCERGFIPNIEALIIRIGFGISCIIIIENKEPAKKNPILHNY